MRSLRKLSGERKFVLFSIHLIYAFRDCHRNLHSDFRSVLTHDIEHLLNSFCARVSQIIWLLCHIFLYFQAPLIRIREKSIENFHCCMFKRKSHRLSECFQLFSVFEAIRMFWLMAANLSFVCQSNCIILRVVCLIKFSQLCFASKTTIHSRQLMNRLERKITPNHSQWKRKFPLISAWRWICCKVESLSCVSVGKWKRKFSMKS